MQNGEEEGEVPAVNMIPGEIKDFVKQSYLSSLHMYRWHLWLYDGLENKRRTQASFTSDQQEDVSIHSR